MGYGERLDAMVGLGTRATFQEESASDNFLPVFKNREDTTYDRNQAEAATSVLKAVSGYFQIGAKTIRSIVPHFTLTL